MIRSVEVAPHWQVQNRTVDRSRAVIAVGSGVRVKDGFSAVMRLQLDDGQALSPRKAGEVVRFIHESHGARQVASLIVQYGTERRAAETIGLYASIVTRSSLQDVDLAKDFDLGLVRQLAREKRDEGSRGERYEEDVLALLAA